MAGVWDQLVDLVCRPPRDIYTDDDLLGKSKGAFAVIQQNKTIRRCYRQDVELVNKRGKKLQCSHYKPNVVPTADGKLPCVIFCHCNSGSRRDAEEAVKELVPRNITVFCMDFEGSGLSEGDWVTLGANEVSDLAVVVDHLRHDDSTSYIGLWGRSMGAVTALMYSRLDPTVAGMVLDSPFSRLTDLMMELVEDQRIRVPKAMLKVAISMLRRSVKKRANFSIDDVAPLDHCTESYIPALFAHGEDDTFIKPQHSKRIYEIYAGPKELTMFEGEHNDPRPQWFIDAAYFFFYRMFQMDEMQILPHFKEYGLREPLGAAVGRPGSRASSIAASEDVQYVDEWGATSHGTPFHAPDASAMLHQLEGADVPEDDEEAMLQAALVASLQEQNSTPLASADTAAAAAAVAAGTTGLAAQIDEDEQLRLAIEASLQDEQARQDFLLSDVAYRERNSDAHAPQGQLTGLAAASNGNVSGNGSGDLAFYQPQASTRTQQQTYSSPGRTSVEGPGGPQGAPAGFRASPRGSPGAPQGAPLPDADEAISPRLADVRSARPRTSGSISSQASSAKGHNRRPSGGGGARTFAMEQARPVPFREAHPSAEEPEPMLSPSAMLFSPGHHTPEELALAKRGSTSSGRPRHARSLSDNISSTGVPSDSGLVPGQPVKSGSQTDLRNMLGGDSMSSWALSSASHAEDWLLSGLPTAQQDTAAHQHAPHNASISSNRAGLQHTRQVEQSTAPQDAVVSQWEQYRSSAGVKGSDNREANVGMAVANGLSARLGADSAKSAAISDDLISFDQLDRSDLGDADDQDDWGLSNMTAEMHLADAPPAASNSIA